MKRTLLSLIICFIMISCSEDNTTEKWIIGEWNLYTNFSRYCGIMEFEHDGNLLITDNDGYKLNGRYSVIDENTLSMSISLDSMNLYKNEYDVEFYSKDSVFIWFFSLSVIPEENHSYLVRID